MTATDATPVDSPTRDLTALSALCLLAAPLVALVARALSTPWYQDESDHLDADRYLTAVADTATRNDIGAGLTFVSAILFAGVAFVLAGIVRERNPRLGLVGGSLTGIGAFGLASVGVASMTFGQIARADERDTMISLMGQLYDSGQTGGVFFLAMVVGAIGAVVLAIGLYRSRVVPRAAAVLTGVGIAAVYITASGPLKSFVVGSALIATVGLGWISVRLWSRRAVLATAGIGAALAVAGGLVLSPAGSVEDGHAVASPDRADMSSGAPVSDSARARTDDRHRILLARYGAHCVITDDGRSWVSRAAWCHD